MTDDQTYPQPDIDQPPRREPIFNVPGVILFILSVLAGVHAVRIYVLGNETNLKLVFDLAFIPARMTNAAIAEIQPLANIWSPLTYSLLHADWSHLLLNGFWLLAFGAVVARRIGPVRFILLYCLGAIGGAALHYLFHANSLSPMVGASAAVSACMGAAVRFAFPTGGSFAREASGLPRQSLVEAFRNRQVIIFIAIWFGINLLVGSGLVDVTGGGHAVAWEAHIGGFLAGLLLFAFFDRKS